MAAKTVSDSVRDAEGLEQRMRERLERTQQVMKLRPIEYHGWPMIFLAILGASAVMMFIALAGYPLVLHSYRWWFG